MKRLLLLVVVLMAVNVTVTNNKNLLMEWKEFKKSHRRNYSAEEDKARLKVFAKNKAFMEDHNDRHARGEVSFKMTSTHFLDWFPEEIEKMKGLKMGKGSKKYMKSFRGEAFKMPKGRLPKTVNWVKKGAVTSVKDQGLCGACYTFSAAGALEGLMFRRNRTVIELSQQNLLDCSNKRYKNFGCNGGLMHNCFKYATDNKGINQNKVYPYEGQIGKCRFKRKNVYGISKGYVILDPPGDEEVLKAAVATIGPISVGIHVDEHLLYYSGGVYSSSKCNYNIDHGILIVGYGTDRLSGKDYWLIKNSWSPDWGEKGFGKISRNAGNMCHIADYAVYPV